MRILDSERAVKYADEPVIVKITDGCWRLGKRLQGGYCIHLMAADGNRMLETERPTMEVGGKRIRINRVQAGLTSDDTRLAIKTCEDGRCVNPDHLIVGTAEDVPRTRKVLRDGTVSIRKLVGQ